MFPAIKVDGLARSFGTHRVVKDLSFEIEAGEIFGLLGPNGAGKTTSIRMMIGELQADAGAISIYGMSMPQQRDQVKSIIGVIPDHQNLYDRLTIRQNLELFRSLYGVPATRIDEVLDLVLMTDQQHKPAQDLSRGMRQRVLIARGLLHNPKVLFLDEPTSALDPHSALLIRSLITRLKAAGATVLLTTHYMEEASQLCDRLAIIHHGCLIATDTPEALRLRFGRKILLATLRESDGTVVTREFPFADKQAFSELQAFFQNDRVVTLHSQEATLEEVFLNLTGSVWQSPETGSPVSSLPPDGSERQ